jgi:hypothetical protein
MIGRMHRDGRGFRPMTARKVNPMRAPGMLLVAIGVGLYSPVLAAQAPAILAGTILTPTVTVATATGDPVVRIKYSAPAQLAELYVLLATPTGNPYFLPVSYAPLVPLPVSGTIAFKSIYNPLMPSSPPGTWTIIAASVSDRAGTTTMYTGSKLAALFPSLTFTVVNHGVYGTTPPVVTSGKLNATTISLSSPVAFLQATLRLTDPIGVFGGDIFLTEPNGTVYNGPGSVGYGGTDGPFAVKNGSFAFGDYLNYGGAKPPTGTWTITGYQVCDLSTNCTTDTNAADIQKLFGTTTIQVTN